MIVTKIVAENYIAYGVPCLICGESVELTRVESHRLEQGYTIEPKICDKCRQAVLAMRKNMGEVGESE